MEEKTFPDFGGSMFQRPQTLQEAFLRSFSVTSGVPGLALSRENVPSGTKVFTLMHAARRST